MKIGKAIKKMVAIGAGATMVGATMFGALAADLASYPAPFVESGKYNALIVFGDNANPADIVGSIDLATNLAYEMRQTETEATGAATTTISDGTAIQTSGQKLYKGDHFNTTKESITKSDLPELLAKQSITDTDGTSYDVTQVIKVLREVSVTFDKTPDNLDDPILNIPTNNNKYNYSTEVSFSPALDTNKTQNKKITLFGKEYTFSANAGELDATTDTGLILYGGGVQKIMTAGDTATMDIEGTQAVVNVVGVNTDASTAMVTCNGESKQMGEGDTETLGGIRVYAKQIFSYTVPAKQGAVELFIGSDKLVLKNDQNVVKGSADVDGTRIAVTQTGSKVSKIVFSVTPNQGTPQVKYLKIGDSYTDPIWGSFKYAFTGITPPLEADSRDIIKVYPSSEDRVMLEFTNRNGQVYDEVIVNGSTTSGDALIWPSDGSYTFHTGNGTVSDATVIKENDKFVLGTKEYSHIYQLKQISLSSSTPKIKVQDMASGASSEELSITTGGTGTYGNYTTLSVDGNSYTIYVNSDGTDVNITSGISNVLYTQNGALIQLPYLNATSVAVGITNGGNQSVVNITEETDYNGGAFKNAANVDLGTGIIQLPIHMNTSSNYDMQVDQPVGRPTDESLSWQTVGTSYDRRAVTKYGSYLKYNTESDVFQMYYSGDASNYQVFIAPTLATVTETGTGTSESITISEIAVGAAKLATEALAADPDLSQNNYVLVGGPCANSAASKIMGDQDNCLDGFESGKAKIKLYENAATGKVAILVAGMDAIDTTRACRAIKTGKLADVDAGAAEVSVTTVTDTPTLTVVTEGAE